MLAGELLEEVVGQEQDVGLPLAQRRHEDREHVQPVVEVLAELARRNGLLEVLVGGGHQPDVGADRLGAAQALELPLLQHAQQLDLRRQIQLADLVEKQRAALGQLEAALLGRLRAREGALLVPEELRLDEIVREARRSSP